MSRKTKFSAAVVAKIVDGLQTGLPRRYAAADAGIPERTFYDWLDGKPEFRLKVEQGEAKFIKDALEHMRRTGKRQWTMSAWMLERRIAECFGKAERLTVDQHVDINVSVQRQQIIASIVGQLPTGPKRLTTALYGDQEPSETEQRALPNPESIQSENDERRTTTDTTGDFTQ